MERVTEQQELERVVDGRRAAVLFHSTWCPYCRSYRPLFERESAVPDVLPVEVVLDEDEHPFWSTYDIDVVPTVLIFENGRVARRLDGRRGKGLAPGDLTRALAP